MLRAVLEINRNLGGTIELNEALGKTLETLFAIFREAESGFIVTREADGELSPRAIRHRDGDPDPLTLSQTALDHVMTRGQGLLSSDTLMSYGVERPGLEPDDPQRADARPGGAADRDHPAREPARQSGSGPTASTCSPQSPCRSP